MEYIRHMAYIMQPGQTGHRHHSRHTIQQAHRGQKGSEGMTQEARAAKNAYMREWRKKNAERERAYQESYWAKKAQENAQQQSQRGDEAYEEA